MNRREFISTCAISTVGHKGRMISDRVGDSFESLVPISVPQSAMQGSNGFKVGKPLWQPFYISPRAGTGHISLDGNWEFIYRESPINSLKDLHLAKEWTDARIPCSVQWALYEAGKLPYPYAYLNSRRYLWTNGKVWYFRRKFHAPALAKDQYVFLCFDGVDYYSRVWLNGTLLGRHEGMFGGPDIEISSALRPGEANELFVEVCAGNYGLTNAWKPRDPGPVIIPWGIAGGVEGRDFFPLGIWRSVRLEIVPPIHLERPFLVTEELGTHQAQLSLEVEILADVQSLEFQLHPWKNEQLTTFRRNPMNSKVIPGPFQLVVTVMDKQRGIRTAGQIFPIRVWEGRNWVRRKFLVPSPQLWWPNGMGDPSLYAVRLELQKQGMQVDALEFDYGIRTIKRLLTSGPQTQDRWEGWQFEVNGRRLFVKGVDWMPADILLNLPRSSYAWLLGMARAAGIQMLRVWGAGLLENDDFYSLADEFGLMVWQEFPIANEETSLYPQDVWESQVMQNIFRLRNHPSLAVYCGGNEFNPYSYGNSDSVGIIERSVADFDQTRSFQGASPDAGDIHTYPNFDPTWFSRLYTYVPFISETGMHNIPALESWIGIIDKKELNSDFSDLSSKEFVESHPEFIHHFIEFQADRVPRMLSLASQIEDMSTPTLTQLSEATQIGAGEYYQIVSEITQANYSVTAGLLPWVFKRPSPQVGIMLVDGFGQPTAPYYFLKRTYESTHIAVTLPYLLWAPKEHLPIRVVITHSGLEDQQDATAAVTVYDNTLRPVWSRKRSVDVKAGPSVTRKPFGNFPIPKSLTQHFFWVVAELADSRGKLLSRSCYWPCCLKMMEDPAVRSKYRESPQPFPLFRSGPWLKREVVKTETALILRILSAKQTGRYGTRLLAQVHNVGHLPAVMTEINVGPDICMRRVFHSTDNFFWLGPGERKDLEVEVYWRDPSAREASVCTARAWNALPRAASFG